MSNDTRFGRRQFLFGSGACLGIALLPVSADATDKAVADAIAERFGSRDIQPGRVTLDIPALAENGNSVALRVDVDSPMSATDHVRAIHVFAPQNPLPDVATFHLTPASGRASASTRIRLGNSQVLTAIAEMHDGSLWSGTAKTVVTLAACIDPLP